MKQLMNRLVVSWVDCGRACSHASHSEAATEEHSEAATEEHSKAAPEEV
jgi:hypothetical protein